MNKIITSVLAIALSGVSLFAQDSAEPAKSNWKLTNVGGLNLTQTSLSNWAAGGENSVSWNVFLNSSANYKKDKWSWDNALVADFGKTYTSSNGWNKSVDKFNVNTKLGYSFAKHWNFSVLGDFLSQFANGYAKPGDRQNGVPFTSTIFSPAYVTLAIGADYKPNDDFSLLISPLTGKMTIVGDKRLSTAGAFGVKPGNTLFTEFGSLLVANYKTNITKDINLISKLTLFSAYNNNYGNIDVNWDVLVAFKINKFLSANASVNLVYDDDVKTVDGAGNKRGAKVQLRQMLGFGLTYSF